MRTRCGQLLLGCAAAVNLLPAVAIFSVDRACATYGRGAVDDDLRLIVRHRGVLFAILGAGLLMAVFRPQLRPVAITANTVSMAGFLALVPLERSVGPALLRVAKVDAVGLILLTGSVIAFRNRRSSDLG